MKSILESKHYLESVAALAARLPMKEGSFLITGATGLIGSFMTDVLLYANRNLEAGYKICALGRSEARLAARFLNENETKEELGLSFLVQDICQPIPEGISADYIVHAASNADPKSYALYPAETLLINIEGTKNILEFARKNPGCRLVFTSSFEVYGTIPEVSVYKEDMYGTIDCGRIRSVYPESKRSAELLVRCYAEEYGVAGVIARLASIYGPTMLANDSKAHAQFIRNGLNHENIVLKSEGIPRRTYCYVGDTIDALFWLLAHGDAGEIYNVSNEKSIASIAEVAKTVAEVCGTEVVFDLPDEVESKGFSTPAHCILDNEKLRMTGWSGSYSLKAGIEETIQILEELE